MTRLIASILSLTLGLGAAFALVSCGSSSKGLLPGDTASQIESNLELVKSQAADGDCEGAQAAAAEVAKQVDELGNDVSRRLREALSEGAARLQSVVASCTPTAVTTQTTETTTQFSDTAPVQTDTEPTTTQSTETTPSTTETTQEEPTTTEPPTTTTQPTTPTPPPPPPGGGDGGGGGGNTGGGSGGIGPGGNSGRGG